MKLLWNILVFLFCYSYCNASETELNISIFTERAGNGYKVFAANNEFCPVSIQAQFTLENLKSSVANDSIVVTPAGSSKFLIATLTPTVTSGKIGFKYDFKFQLGDVTSKKWNETYTYQLPFANRQRFKVSQGYGGNSTHQDLNALDFEMPLKTPIHAAKSGTVVRIVNHNNRNCFDVGCEKYNNFILVYHEDGTFAEYGHIYYKSNVVNLGDKVTKGQQLCLSGNTGYSSGPHLHFAVYLPEFDTPNYVTTFFETSKENNTLLKEGKTYKRP